MFKVFLPEEDHLFDDTGRGKVAKYPWAELTTEGMCFFVPNNSLTESQKTTGFKITPPIKMLNEGMKISVIKTRFGDDEGYRVVRTN